MHCNDDAIQRATLGEVLDSEGYMLFYVKSRIDYAEP